MVPNGAKVENGCQILTVDFDPIHTMRVNSTALFGGGWIDRISGKSITNYRIRHSIAKDRQLTPTSGAVFRAALESWPTGG